jgi:hypothetical protein
MPAVRDYIPDGEASTPAETHRRTVARSLLRGGLRQDFVPGEKHTLQPPSGKGTTGADAAIEKAMARQATAAYEDYAATVEKLKQLNVAQAVEFFRTAPTAVLEMAQAAEMLNGNRSSLLERFPAPDPDVVEKYRQIAAKGPYKASGADAKASTPDAEEK